MHQQKHLAARTRFYNGYTGVADIIGDLTMSVRISKLKIHALPVLITLLGLLTGIAGCGKEDVSVAFSHGNSRGGQGGDITALSITPASASISRGSTQAFTATATYSDGSTGDVTSGITWSITPGTGRAAIAADGVATGQVAGDVTITATDTASGVSGTTPLTLTGGSGYWTWLKGTAGADIFAHYGTKGVPHPTNQPGSVFRQATGYSQKDKKLYFQGGSGKATDPTNGITSAMWVLDPATVTWTWTQGPSGVSNPIVRGTKGVADPANTPGSRMSNSRAMDPDGNLWLFGGFGGYSDLWKFNGTAWTWVAGPDTSTFIGDWGTKGVSAPTNNPSRREKHAINSDRDGNIWLFGGYGIDSTTASLYRLRDLWKFDPTTNEWTWMAGPSTGNAGGVYGTKGVSAPGNYPGGSEYARMVFDSQNNLWLFGGTGFDSTSAVGSLDDLWKYDTTTNEWTWMAGSGIANSTANTVEPKGRSMASMTVDAADNIWLYTGAAAASPNDLWKWNGSTWTKIADLTSNVFGTMGVEDPANHPWAAYYDAVIWFDEKGSLYVYGGVNSVDLWKYEP